MKQRLIFLHIEKTAGTTFRTILRFQYFRKRIYRIIWNSEDFLREKRVVREKTHLLQGHMLFGMHNHLPTPAAYITFLRDPIERIISAYFYSRRLKERHFDFHKSHKSSWIQEFSDFCLNDQSCFIDNYQTRLLSGLWPRFGECSNDILDAACENIDHHFAAVGITEMFDESLLLFRESLGWFYPPFYITQNVSPGRLRKTDLPETLKSHLETFNQFDLRLYEEFRRKLIEKVQDPGFSKKVQRFRSMNKALQLPLKTMLLIYRKFR